MTERIPRRLIEHRYNQYAQGHCECCGKRIVRYKRGRQQGKGSWEAHHGSPSKCPTTRNIKIMCSSGRNCHLFCGHKGSYTRKGILPRVCRKKDTYSKADRKK